MEPGTNPGFLYQQNTMRDALVAALNLNIFNNHCDVVVMANIAQTVNVLQSVVLTDGPRMVLTPTYHIFDMYKGHQGAREVETYAETKLVSCGDWSVPNIHVSASQNGEETVLLTVVNLSDTEPAPIEVLSDAIGARSSVTGTLLTGASGAYNTFDSPDTVRPVPIGRHRGRRPPLHRARLLRRRVRGEK